MSNRRRLRTAFADSAEAPSRPLGFEPKLNAYRCDKCGGNTVTVDVDEGVTPMFHRPSKRQTRDMDPAMREHIDRGGLALRKIEAAA